MSSSVVDPEDFLADGILVQQEFLDRADNYDWSRFQDQKALVRGCASAIIPPWVYMYITGKLSGLSKSVRFGNEHDNIVVYRRPQSEEK